MMQKALSISLSIVLTLALMPSLAFANTSSSSVNEPSASADVVEPSLSEQENYAESWRYIKGEPVTASATASKLKANCPTAWNKNYGISSFGYNGAAVSVGGTKAVVIDVSKWQSEINWTKVKGDGIDYAIIMCGYGQDQTDQDDPYWIKNVQGAKKAGIKIGAYLYSYAYNETMALGEANHALRCLKEAGLEPEDLDLPVYYDLENTAGKGKPCIKVSETQYEYISNDMLGKMATVFCGALSEKGYRVGVYSNTNWWTNYLTAEVFNNPEWSKWVAQYGKSCQYAGVKDMWQFTECGTVNGVSSTYVDVNFMYVKQWRSFPDVVKEVNKKGGIDKVWYVSDGWLEYVVDNGIMSGYTTGKNAGNYGPYDSITRGQIAVMLYRAACAEDPSLLTEYGSTTEESDYANIAFFKDLEPSMYYTAAVNWARDADILTGDSKTKKVRAEDPITRQELCVMFARYANDGTIPETTLNPEKAAGIKGMDEVDSWAQDGVYWAVNNDVIGGVDNKDGTYSMKPKDNTWRASAAKMITVVLRDIMV